MPYLVALVFQCGDGADFGHFKRDRDLGASQNCDGLTCQGLAWDPESRGYKRRLGVHFSCPENMLDCFSHKKILVAETIELMFSARPSAQELSAR